jgi:hypothetical protein
MRRTQRITSIIALSATIVVGPALSASAHDGTGKGNRAGKSQADGRQGSHKGKVIAALVSAGTITQAQGDAVNAAIKASTAPRSTTDAERRSKYNTIMAPLVSASTITQAQADAIVNAIVAEGAARAAKTGDSAKRAKGSKSS